MECGEEGPKDRSESVKGDCEVKEAEAHAGI